MLIFCGSKTILLWLGFPEVHPCSNCGQPRQFQLALQYRLVHLYFIFGTASQRQYSRRCTTCQHGWEIETSQATALVQKDPVPFMHRWGLLTGLVAFALLIVVLIIRPNGLFGEKGE